MLKNIKAVIFDLDGTLVDSMWLWRQIDIDYLEMKGHPLPEDLQDAIEGMSFTETANYFKERFGLNEDVEYIKDTWNGMAKDYYLNKVPLKEHVEKLLGHLREGSYKIGIGTSNSKELVGAIVDKYGLLDYCHSIRTGCEVERGKPYPDIFLKVAEDLGVDPSECLVFEDIPNGIRAARNAGMKVCAVYDAFSEYLTEEKKALSDYYIESYSELVALLDKASLES